MADHITGGLSPIYHPPEGIHGPVDLDLNAWSWLDEIDVDISKRWFWWHTQDEEEHEYMTERYLH